MMSVSSSDNEPYQEMNYSKNCKIKLKEIMKESNNISYKTNQISLKTCLTMIVMNKWTVRTKKKKKNLNRKKRKRNKVSKKEKIS